MFNSFLGTVTEKYADSIAFDTGNIEWMIIRSIGCRQRSSHLRLFAASRKCDAAFRVCDKTRTPFVFRLA